MTQSLDKVVKDVMIGFPCYDNRSEVDILQELLGSVIDPNCPVSSVEYYNGDSLIPRARNKIAERFMASDAKFLMFVDSDIVVNRHMITRLRSHNKGIVGGIYLKKKLPYSPVMNAQIAEEDGLMVMREIGTGLMMIRKDVFAAVRAANPEHDYKYDDDEPNKDTAQGHDWFRVGVRNGRYLSEDYFFCQNAGDLGIKTYLDRGVMGVHIGRMRYPTEDKQIFEAASVILNNYNPTVPVIDEVKGLVEAGQKLLSRKDQAGEDVSLPKPKEVDLDENV